jgi:predicted transcriptional regulator
MNYKEMGTLFSQKIVSRILKRLKSANLIRTPEEKEYVFFFRSRRDPRKENFSLTERRVYSSIPDEGISAKRLAKKARLSIRRIYKYLRGLKGKKLVFSRKTLKVFSLTDKGEELGSLLKEIQDIVDETWTCSEQILNCIEKN